MILSFTNAQMIPKQVLWLYILECLDVILEGPLVLEVGAKELTAPTCGDGIVFDKFAKEVTDHL